MIPQRLMRSPGRISQHIQKSHPFTLARASISSTATCRSPAQLTTQKEARPYPEILQEQLDKDDGTGDDEVRLPRAVQATYLRPLRREAQYNVPTCDLQLRSYSVRNLEFMADIALRAAYYLHLPAFGPIPLPRITERWTVPKSHFIYKKNQENFERITMRRLIQIKDGHPETVQLWLAFLRKHQYYGVGMKANVWEYNELGVGKTMDVNMEEMKKVMEPEWELYGRGKTMQTADKVMEVLNSDKFRRVSREIGPGDGMRPEPKSRK